MTSLQSEGGGFASLRQRRWTDCSDILREIGLFLCPPIGVYRDSSSGDFSSGFPAVARRCRSIRRDVDFLGGAAAFGSSSMGHLHEPHRGLQGLSGEIQPSCLFCNILPCLGCLRGLSLHFPLLIDHLQGIPPSNLQISVDGLCPRRSRSTSSVLRK